MVREWKRYLFYLRQGLGSAKENTYLFRLKYLLLKGTKRVLDTLLEEIPKAKPYLRDSFHRHYSYSLPVSAFL